jgi:hypothetical protein
VEAVIVLETECQWTNRAEKGHDWDEYCENGYVMNENTRIGLCPRCHGRGSVPTMTGRELLDFVRFWADKEWR